MRVIENPLLSMQPEDGWIEINNPYRYGSGYSFKSESPILNGTFIRTFEHGEWVVGWVYFGKGVAGPPGLAHGGAQTCVLDDLMGGALWHMGRPGLTREIKFNFADTGVALEKALVMECQIEEKNDETTTVWAGIRGEHGRVATEAEATFVRLRPEKVKEVLERGGYPLSEMQEYTERHGF